MMAVSPPSIYSYMSSALLFHCTDVSLLLMALVNDHGVFVLIATYIRITILAEKSKGRVTQLLVIIKAAWWNFSTSTSRWKLKCIYWFDWPLYKNEIWKKSVRLMEDLSFSPEVFIWLEGTYDVNVECFLLESVSGHWRHPKLMNC